MTTIPICLLLTFRCLFQILLIHIRFRVFFFCVFILWIFGLVCRIIDETTKDAAVVDPVEPHKVLRVAQENEVDLKFVLTTHHHWSVPLLLSFFSLSAPIIMLGIWNLFLSSLFFLNSTFCLVFYLFSIWLLNLPVFWEFLGFSFSWF